jgi:hypothetical protein
MVNTKVKPVAFGLDAPTPQAQKLEDVIANDPSKLRSSTAPSLERKGLPVAGVLCVCVC